MSKKVRVAIIGVGNCANSLVQGVQFYKDADPNEEVPGLMHVSLGGYHIHDIEFSAAIDIDADKVARISARQSGADKQHDPLCRCPASGRNCAARYDARRPRKVSEGKDRGSAR